MFFSKKSDCKRNIKNINICNSKMGEEANLIHHKEDPRTSCMLLFLECSKCYDIKNKVNKICEKENYKGNIPGCIIPNQNEINIKCEKYFKENHLSKLKCPILG